MGGQAPPGSLRDRIAVLTALVTLVCVAAALLLSRGTHLLMPGPLTSAHGAIGKCSACHTRSGSSRLSWLHGLVAGDPLADAKACLACHKMPDTAFAPHGASAEVLAESTRRLTSIAADIPAPLSARAQNIVAPAQPVVARDLYCATCHQEHQGLRSDLARISNEQCRSCHVVKFDSFDGRHPGFDRYPFKRRTRIIYDHAGHFGKHYPEVAKKDAARRIPEACSTCHDSGADRRVMAVAPFERTCAACHLDQIVGKERASGPKGVAFLTVPGLDLDTLRKRNAAIGEWPDVSDAELSPFMKVMIGRDERGRALIAKIEGLNLQDLTGASTEQVAAVTDLAWEVKQLFHALIKGKASDVLGNFDIGGGARLSAALVADLTASIPRDVVVGAQQQWLPNLAAEMAGRPTSPAKPSGPALSQPSAPRAAGPDGAARPDGAAVKTYTTNAGPDDTGPDENVSASGERDGPVGKRWHLPSGTPRAIGARNRDAGNAPEPEPEPGSSGAANANPDRSRKGASDAEKAPEPEGAAAKADAAGTDPGGTGPSPADGQLQGTAAEQTDDLLFPTEAELRAIKAGGKVGEAPQPQGPAGGADPAAARSDGGSSAAAPAEAAAPGEDANVEAPAAAPSSEPRPAPVIGIESDVDPESWAEYGGWYRQDYAIFYRPTGHKDKFIYAWLFLTGPRAPRGDTGPAAAVFDYLTAKDAQGSCTKCHSVDDIRGRGRMVNFSPVSAAEKKGRFTAFVHEPHFGVVEPRGCLTCHSLDKQRPYLKSYEQGDPHSFASNFGDVKKDLCQTCHTAGMARQDCLLCHAYHVNGAATPIMRTRLPVQ